MPVEEMPPVKDNDPEWQQGVDLDFNASASASGPKRHSRGRRATVSVMEAPTKKPPGHASSSKPTAQEIDPVYWESQTSTSYLPLYLVSPADTAISQLWPRKWLQLHEGELTCEASLLLVR